MKIFKYTLGTVVLYVVFLIVLLPASFVVNQVTLPPSLQLGMIQGTLWQGQVSSVKVEKLDLKNVQWDLIVSSLFAGRLNLDLNIGNSRDPIRGNGYVGYSLDGVFAEQFTLNAPVTTLTTIQPLPMDLVANGQVSLLIEDYQQGEPWCEALNGLLTLKSSQISNNFGRVNIDNAQVKLVCDKGDLIATMKPKTNTLGIDVKVVVNKNNMATLSGFVKPPSNAPRDFVEMLKFTGPADSQGRYPLKLEHRL